MVAAVAEQADGGALARILEAVEGAAPSRALEAVTQELREALGALDVAFLAADLSGRALVRLARAEGERRGSAPHSSGGPLEFLPLEGGPRERALREQELVVHPEGTSWVVLAPITERGEALGLLEMRLPGEPSEGTVDRIHQTAHLLAFVLIANRRHTDLFEQSRRSTPYTLPAEIQRRLLPEASTCEGGSFTLAGWLEPAADVGGDTFDYSAGEDTLHFSVTDAMGHGVESALSATLCVGNLRNCRRVGATLLEQAANTNEVLSTKFHDQEGFVTGLLGRVDLATGMLSLLNAGHVPPYLVRDGEVTVLELTASLPFGVHADASYAVREFPLSPGDRLVLVTDGIVERTGRDLDITESLMAVEGLHPREATRRLADKVLERSGGELADDALLLILDWHGVGQERTSHAGADAKR